MLKRRPPHWFLTTLICSLIASSCRPAGTRIQSASLVFEGCNIVTMRSEEVQRGMTLVVDGDTIAAIGADGSFQIPDHPERVPCEGRYVLPGLTDAHIHLGHSTELLSYLLSGVTTVFNLGGDHLDLFSGERRSILAVRDSVKAGFLLGPTIYSSGQALDGDPATGPFQRPLSSVDEGEAAVEEQAEAGFDFIKVYDALDVALHAAIIRKANELGLPVFGHIPEAVGVGTTLASGQAVVTHAEEFYPVFDTVQDLNATLRTLSREVSESGTVIIPNGAFIRGLIRQIEDLDEELARPEARYLAPAVRVWWDPEYNYYVNRDDPETFAAQNRRRSRWISRLVAELHDHGVPLLAGSDASVPVALPGPSLHDELRELVEAGLTPFEALEATTANVERFMAAHRPDDVPFGTIAVGSRADLAVVETNPLESPTGPETVYGVVVRGDWYEAGELRALRDSLTAGWSAADRPRE